MHVLNTVRAARAVKVATIIYLLGAEFVVLAYASAFLFLGETIVHPIAILLMVSAVILVFAVISTGRASAQLVGRRVAATYANAMKVVGVTVLKADRRVALFRTFTHLSALVGYGALCVFMVIIAALETQTLMLVWLWVMVVASGALASVALVTALFSAFSSRSIAKDRLAALNG